MKVSLRLELAGEQLTNINVFASETTRKKGGFNVDHCFVNVGLGVKNGSKTCLANANELEIVYNNV